MAEIINKVLKEQKLSRRTFIKTATAVTAAAGVQGAGMKAAHAENFTMPNYKEINSVCSLCSGGCAIKVMVGSDGKIARVYGDRDNPYNKGGICSKPMQAAQALYNEDRVLYPMKKIDGKFQRITWDEAIDTIAEKFRYYITNFTNSSIIAFTSKIGQAGCKEAMKTFQQHIGYIAFGTTPVCYATEKKILKSMFGQGAATNPMSDAINCKIMLKAGCNNAATKAGQFHWLQEGRRRGMKLVVIDVRYTDTAKNADEFYLINPGTDGALGMALLHVVIKENLYDHEFVEKYVVGFEALAESVKDFTVEKAAKITGISEENIIRLAREFGQHKGAGMFYPGRGVVMTNNSSSPLLAFYSLMVILGNIGKPGAGILSHLTASYGSVKNIVPKEEVVKPVKKWKHQEVYEGMEKGEIKMVLTAGNPGVTWPDSTRMRNAIDGVEFHVSHSVFMDDTAQLADIVLPAASWFEVSGPQKGVNWALMWREAAHAPLGEAKSGQELYYLLAQKMGMNMDYFVRTPEEYWARMMAKNEKVAGISIERMLKEKVVHYPCKSLDETPKLKPQYTKLKFKTPSGKIEIQQLNEDKLKTPIAFYMDPVESPGNSKERADEYPLMFSTSKVAPHYHTQGQYHAWAREIEQPYLEVHPATATKFGVKDGEKVVVETAYGKITLIAKVTELIHENVVNTQPYFGVNSPYKLEPANVLFPIDRDKNGSFMQKNVQCKIYKG